MNSMALKNEKEEEIIQSVLKIFDKCSKNFSIEFWNGQKINLSDNPVFTIKFLDKQFFTDIMFHPNIFGFAEGFMSKKFDIEGDIFQALKLKDTISKAELSGKDKLNILKASSFGFNVHTKSKDKEFISHHYDVSNDFYKLFLGDTMMYSCAYFENENNTIDEAQKNKIEHICKKLRLKKGERLLDIGCGWGSMIIEACKNYGVHAVGVTISKEQFEYAKQRIKDEGIADLCEVRLLDYRDIEGEEVYDKVVSIGMFEHVGTKNLPVYFNKIKSLLKPNGIFLNHGITNRVDKQLSSNEGKFIQKYIFPGGELKNISYVLEQMEIAGFDIVDVECLRQHYYKTLKCWVENLKSNMNEAVKITNENLYRTWILYMAGCAINFQDDYISVYQVLLEKQNKGFNMPLTRNYMS